MPPVNMRLINRTEAPSEETPPSTRPSSSASNSTSNSGPQRSTSMDSIHNSSTFPDKPAGEEVIPTRFTRSTPRVNVNASMQFVKTKPAALYKSARDQIQKAEEVKQQRKISLLEEEDYQINLDKWKNSRRKRNEEILERVIESKKYEEEETYSRERRKSKTFSEMRQDKDKRGRRYNLAVHDDDNDLTDLGITPSTKSSIEEQPEENEGKDVDIKDTKSDAGFCTGSDTGSDGVFAEDNISDTSSALGDKKEPIEPENHTLSKLPQVNGVCEKTPVSEILPDPTSNMEYTFEKATEQYKQFTERSKMKSTSMTNLSPRATKDEKVASKVKLQEKLGYFSGELAREERIVPKMRHKDRCKMQKIDIKKRRSMFELREGEVEEKSNLNSSPDVGRSLKNIAHTFENGDKELKSQSIIPQRDVNFKEKLACFNKSNCESTLSKKVMDRDKKIYVKTPIPKRQQPLELKASSIQATSLKQKIASFERGSAFRTKSLSTECLSKANAIKPTCQPEEECLKKSPSTPYLVVDIKSKNEFKPACSTPFKNIPKSTKINDSREVYEEIEKSQVVRDVESAPIYSIFSPNESQNLEEDLNNSYELPLVDIDDRNLNSTYLEMGSGLQNEKPSTRGNSSTDEFHPISPVPSVVYAELDLDSLEAREEYGDDDIDEVMQGCDRPVESTVLDDTYLEMNTQNVQNNEHKNGCSVLKPTTIFNNETYNMSDPCSPANHTYQSLVDMQFSPSNHTYESLDLSEATPPLPPKPAPSLALEVLDVYWTEDGGPNQVIPPSVPPPPPPAEDEEDDVVDGDMVADAEKPYSPCVSLVGAGVDVSSLPEPKYENQRTIADANRQNLMMKRSMFLGVTTPCRTEELSIKPPPDMKVFIKQERDSERQLIQSNSNKSENDLDSNAHSRFKYTWQDRMRDDSSNDAEETSSHLEFQCKLAELEQEMKDHDRQMLLRTDHLDKEPEKPVISSNPPDSANEFLQNKATSANFDFVPDKKPTASKPFSVQEFYPAPGYDAKHSQNNGKLATKDFAAQNNDHFSVKKATKESALRKNLSLIPSPTLQAPPKPSRCISEVGLVSRQSKPNIKALSATPKPKRVENDSWIAHKKLDTPKKDINSHWVLQEAEQRRLDSMARLPGVPALPFRPPNLIRPTMSCSSIPSLQNIPNTQAATVPTKLHKYSLKTEPPYVQNNLISNNSSIYANVPNSSSSSNSSSDNISCKMKGVTYNPHQPATPHKPLPASIISSITQRVSNKNKSNVNDRSVMYNSKINGHDYMNSETIEAIRSKNDVLSTPATITTRHASASLRSSMQNSPPSDISAMNSSVEDQRLLSVSGKKKCSHCCDELGRGAAMIIESLRLFYHIPCFKCCVCGSQLGNGTAGADVRVRNHKLRCHNCYSSDEGMKFSKV